MLLNCKCFALKYASCFHIAYGCFTLSYCIWFALTVVMGLISRCTVQCYERRYLVTGVLFNAMKVSMDAAYFNVMKELI